ncbi:glycosyltransferase involved in cell wall biosynthesis [Paraburkholderia sp. GAS199]|uniref:glycosyltransferase n=1 Tax=Paraburkholderia sp. GAS199 TaxID=3035126 RepID=UPI003D217533
MIANSPAFALQSDATPTIFILHPGRANYPEIAAYQDFFGKRGFVVDSGTLEEYERFLGKDNCILWCIMGFYRHPLRARFVIHDYRSLSVRPLSWLKDRIKRFVNQQPDLRIFQNESMRAEMNFHDNVPTLTLPMGVPDWLFDLTIEEPHAERAEHTFSYVGEISRERGFDRLLSAFRKHVGSGNETFVLVGAAERELLSEFGKIKGLVFTGKLPQPEALQVVKQSRYAVSYFPYHRPHCFQTPTKFLEYAALGKSIVCNDAPSNLEAIRRYGISAHVTGRDIFDEVLPSHRVSASPNDRDKMRSSSWQAVIKQSQVLETIRKSATQRVFSLAEMQQTLNHFQRTTIAGKTD